MMSHHIVDTNSSPYRQAPESSSSSVGVDPQKQYPQPRAQSLVATFPFPASGGMMQMAMRGGQDVCSDDDSDADMMSTTSDDDTRSDGEGEGYNDDASFDSWGSSCSDDSEEDEAYFRAAATVHAVQTSRAMARPLSLQEITALANASGRRGAKPATAMSMWPRAASMPQMTPEEVHQQQMTCVGMASQAVATAAGPASSSLASSMAPTSSSFNDISSIGSIANSSASMRPDEKLQAIWKERGMSSQYHPYHSLNNFFLPLQPKHIDAFTTEVVQAVRNKDLAAVQNLHQRGVPLQCSNRHGESIVHMVCRQSTPEVLAYLMHTAGVNIRVCCDSGRTPLHDACWKTTPDFDIIILLLEQCPDMIKITDKRGFTPLSYVPRDKWSEWCDFLEQNAELLQSRELA